MNFRPLKTETEQQFVDRAEGPLRNDLQRTDAFPKAVAQVIWNHRERIWNAPEEFPKKVGIRHLEPGLVFYEYLNEGRGAKILVTREFMDRMRGSVEGKPIINERHKDMTPEEIRQIFKRGDADGVIVKGFNNPIDGWDWVDCFVWDEATVQNIRNGYSASCQYEVSEWLPGGSYHNIPYEREAVAGAYEHIAIVKNGRYEGVKIVLMNSKQGGGLMKITFWPFNKETKETAKNAVEVDSEKAAIEVDGVDVPVAAAVEAYQEQQKARNAAAAKPQKLSDHDSIMVDGKPVSVADLKAAHAEKVKNASEAEMKKAHEDGKHEDKANENCAMCNKAKNEDKDKADDKDKDKSKNDEKDGDDKEKDKDKDKAKNAAAEEAARQKAEAKDLERLANERRDLLEGDVPLTLQEKAEKGREMFGSAQPAKKAA